MSTGVVNFNLVAFLIAQQAFSEAAFGPGERSDGVCDHIEKELAEVRAKPHDLSEWIDIATLALDGAWRAGHRPEAIASGLATKLRRNMARTWPDWRQAELGKAIEHDRTAATPTEEERALRIAAFPPVPPVTSDHLALVFEGRRPFRIRDPRRDPTEGDVLEHAYSIVQVLLVEYDDETAGAGQRITLSGYSSYRGAGSGQGRGLQAQQVLTLAEFRVAMAGASVIECGGYSP